MMKAIANLLMCVAAVSILIAVDLQAKDGNPAEASLEAFVGEASLELTQVHPRGRFPNVVVSVEGTLLAVLGNVVVRRSEDGGVSWGDEISVGKGFMGGGVIVNETNGDILVFVEEKHPPAPLTVYRSQDDGKTWAVMDVEIKPDSNGNVPSMHMNDAGITLRHGSHAGRLIRASRHYAGRNHRSKWAEHYTNAIYSDDNGKTWNTCKPFADMGTGEAALVELSDGRLYYNSRAHWYKNDKEPPLRRRCAYSADGGETWTDWQIVNVLPDGPQNTNYGCMGGLVRLPISGRDVLIYSNCDSKSGRKQGTAWASFDGGKTWPVKRLLDAGNFAYSSMAAGRPGSKTEGWIYCHYESRGSKVARFNLSWLVQGEATGNGEIPAWASKR
jgi:sialidase-1